MKSCGVEITQRVASSVAEKLLQPFGNHLPIASLWLVVNHHHTQGCMGISILSKRGYRTEQAALFLINTPFSGNPAIPVSSLLYLKAKY